jgi:hypothetical protein
LLKAIADTFGERLFVMRDGQQDLDIRRVLDLSPNPQALLNFNASLRAIQAGEKEFNALEAVERVLIAHDLIAVANYLDVEVAEGVVAIYQFVIGDLTKATLPFIAIQRALRGDPDFKSHYLHLLDRIGGLSMPVIDASPAAGMLYSTSVASSITKLRLANSIFTVFIGFLRT